MKLKELLLGLPVEKIVGDCEVEILSPRSWERAECGNITLAVNRRIWESRESVSASAVITDSRLDSNYLSGRVGGGTLVLAVHPLYLWAKVLERFIVLGEETGVSPMALVDPTAVLGRRVSVGPFAVIGPRVTIGEETKIGAHTVVERDVVVGRRCALHPRVVLREGSILGDRVILYPGVVIGSDGFGFTPSPEGLPYKVPQLGRVRIEDDVEIGANSCVDRAALDETVISRGVKIDNLVQVAHNVRIGEGTIVAGMTGIAGSTTIGAGCLIGGGVGIADHVKIGDGAILAARTGVSGDVEAGAKMAGTPMMEMRVWQRLFGHLRRFDTLLERVERLEKDAK